MERCQRGRSGQIANLLYPQGYPGFESLSLRHEQKKSIFQQCAPVAQLDRASVCGTGGRRFESSRVYQGEMSEWLKEHAWKACKWVTVSGVRIPVSPPVPVIRTIGRYEPCQIREEAALSVGRCVADHFPYLTSIKA